MAVGGTAGALAMVSDTKPVQCWGPPMPPEHGPWHAPGPCRASVETKPNGDVEITFPEYMRPGHVPPHRISEGLEFKGGM